MNCQVKQRALITEATDVLVLEGYEDVRTWPKAYQELDNALGGQLRELRTNGEFSGKNQQTVLIHTRGAVPARRILLVGLGKETEITLDRIRQAMGTASKKVRQTGAQRCSAPVIGSTAFKSSPSVIAQAMVEGTMLGGYRFNHYRSDNGEPSNDIRSLTLLTMNATQVKAIKAGLRLGEASAAATSFARDLCNHPANVMTPSRVVQEAKRMAKDLKVKLTVLEQEDQERLGMGGLLGVSRGSQESPKFIILEYLRGKKKRRPSSWWGKPSPLIPAGFLSSLRKTWNR